MATTYGSRSTFTTFFLFLGVSSAISVPSNVQSLYDSIVAQGECTNKAATGFTALDGGPDSKSNPLQIHTQVCNFLLLANNRQLSRIAKIISTIMESFIYQAQVVPWQTWT